MSVTRPNIVQHCTRHKIYNNAHSIWYTIVHTKRNIQQYTQYKIYNSTHNTTYTVTVFYLRLLYSENYNHYF